MALFWDIWTLCHAQGNRCTRRPWADESPLAWPMFTGHCPAMDSHRDALLHLCRVCGGSIDRNDRNSKIENCSKEMKAIWDIHTWNDDPEIYPDAICHKCFRKVRHHRAGTRSYLPNPDFKPPNWTKHSRTGGCQTCSLMKTQRGGTKGNRCKFKRNIMTTMAPPSSSTQPAPTAIYKLDSDNIFDFLQVSNHVITNETINICSIQQYDFFMCSICCCILSNPVYTPCQHSYCSQCLTKYFQFHRSMSVTCPICNQQVPFHSVQLCPQILTSQLETLTVKCIKCQSTNQLCKFRDHCCPKVMFIPQSSQVIRSLQSSNIADATATLADAAREHLVGMPVPEHIKRATDKWTWLQLKASEDNTLSLHTSGQVISL